MDGHHIRFKDGGVRLADRGVEEGGHPWADDSTHLLCDSNPPTHVSKAGDRTGGQPPAGRSLRFFRRTEGSVSMDSRETTPEGDGEPPPPGPTPTTTPTPVSSRCGSQALSRTGASYSRADGAAVCLRRVVKLVKSMGGLVVLLLAYTFLGAWIMITLEGPTEDRLQAKVYNVREMVSAELRNNTSLLRAGQLNDSEWQVRADASLRLLEDTVHATGLSSTSKKKWTFFGAVLFCVTTYTTIGYGNIAPSTDGGRVATMLYASVGIPLALIVLADLGRRLTLALKFLWGFVRRYYYTGYCKRLRDARPRRFSYTMTELDVADVPGTGDLMRRGSYTYVGDLSGLRDPGGKGENGPTPGRSADTPQLDGRAGQSQGGGGERGAEGGENHAGSQGRNGDVRRSSSKERDGAKAEAAKRSLSGEREAEPDARRSRSNDRDPPVIIKINLHDDGDANSRVRTLDSVSKASRTGSVFLDQAELSEDYNLPLLVAVGFIFAYIFLGAGMYTLWEDWTYLESFYFVFITTSTIGFGDVLPEHPNFFLLSCVYTFLGLALVSMCINVISEFMTKTIDRAKEKVDQAKTKAKAKARAARGKLSEVGHMAKNKVRKKESKGSLAPVAGKQEPGHTEKASDDDNDNNGNGDGTAEMDTPAAVTQAGDRPSPAKDNDAVGKTSNPADLPSPASDVDETLSFRTADDRTASVYSVSDSEQKS